jgi:hypothetical protein
VLHERDDESAILAWSKAYNPARHCQRAASKAGRFFRGGTGLNTGIPAIKRPGILPASGNRFSFRLWQQQNKKLPQEETSGKRPLPRSANELSHICQREYALRLAKKARKPLGRKSGADNRQIPELLHRDAFGEVAGFIDVAAQLDSEMVGE